MAFHLPEAKATIVVLANKSGLFGGGAAVPIFFDIVNLLFPGRFPQLAVDARADRPAALAQLAAGVFSGLIATDGHPLCLQRQGTGSAWPSLFSAPHVNGYSLAKPVENRAALTAARLLQPDGSIPTPAWPDDTPGVEVPVAAPSQVSPAPASALLNATSGSCSHLLEGAEVAGETIRESVQVMADISSLLRTPALNSSKTAIPGTRAKLAVWTFLAILLAAGLRGALAGAPFPGTMRRVSSTGAKNPERCQVMMPSHLGSLGSLGSLRRLRPRRAGTRHQRATPGLVASPA